MRNALLLLVTTLALLGCQAKVDEKRSELILEYKSVEKSIDIYENELKEADQAAQDKIKTRSDAIQQQLDYDIAAIMASGNEKELKIQELKKNTQAEIAKVVSDAKERAEQKKKTIPDISKVLSKDWNN